MDTEDGFENASGESSEGDTISGSESAPWSKSERNESSSDNEGGESPSKALQETQVPLTAYEAARLKRIESNNKKLAELGLQALANSVGVLRAEELRCPENLSAGRVQVSQEVVEVFEDHSVAESTISDVPAGSREKPGAPTSSLPSFLFSLATLASSAAQRLHALGSRVDRIRVWGCEVVVVLQETPCCVFFNCF